IEQVSEDGRDRDWNKDWLQKTDDIRHNPDDGDEHEDQEANGQRADRGPNCFLLPFCRITRATRLTHGFSVVVLLTRVFWASILAAKSLFEGSRVLAFCLASLAGST